jgi:hypothetical protein
MIGSKFWQVNGLHARAECEGGDQKRRMLYSLDLWRKQNSILALRWFC